MRIRIIQLDARFFTESVDIHAINSTESKLYSLKFLVRRELRR